VSVLMRAADIEARALFVPGGLYGGVRETLGSFPARIAAAALLVDRSVLGALAAVVAGHYVATAAQTFLGAAIPATVAGDTGPILIAAALIAVVWWMQRQARSVPDRMVAQWIAAAIGVLVILTLWSGTSAISQPMPSPELPVIPLALQTRVAGWPTSLVG